MSYKNDNSEGEFIVVAIIGVAITIFFLVMLFRGFVHWMDSRPTTYCTNWTQAISITPTNHDNGKYSDEQYIVKYADGSIDGQDQGDIPFARCTRQVQVPDSQKEPGWKIVTMYGVQWDE